MRRLLAYAMVALLFAALGFALGGTRIGREATQRVSSAALETAADAVAASRGLDGRERVLLENPTLIPAIQRGGSFGGRGSLSVARNMFSRLEDAIEDAKQKTEIVEVAPRTWLVRMPIVNAAVFETDEGLVVVDTGMGPAGPALLEAIRSVSEAPIHTVIYTHGHVDHAYGTWALVEAGEEFQVVAHQALPNRFERYLRLRGSIARYMSQPEEQLPKGREDLVWPTLTFDDRMQLVIGGEKFVLVHHRGETDDQLYVWVPGRGALASADYYQGFLPNAGNGKRVQRHPEEWAAALREMASLGPRVLLPAHGEPSTDPAAIRENLGVHAEALQFIADRTIELLNSGLRKDEVVERVELPPHLANHPTLNVQYVTVQDIAKMVVKQYTGWWDDVPSHWTPAPLVDEAREIAALSGGVPVLSARARELAATDLRLASHLADWAFLADPESRDAQEAVLEVYRQRILDPASNTQEMLAYIDAMAAARARQLTAAD